MMGFSSCSEIDSRMILTETIVIPIEKVDSLDFLPTVLVEDYTGQMCTWCPDGARLLSDIQNSYGLTRVIPVSTHAGGMGVKDSPSMIGLMNDLGEYYWEQNGFTESTAQPIAVFNRRRVSENRSQWESIVVEELTRECSIALNVSASHVTDRTVNVSAEVTSKSPMSCYLQLWLVENGIIAPQMDHGKVNKEYVHDHILRMAINGNDGEPVSIGDKAETKEYKFSVPEKYVIDNCHIIAFVYDNSGVLKAVSTRLVEAE